MDFKSSAHDLDSRQIRDIYLETQSAHMQRETDLNQASIDLVLDYLQGQSVLDIACGSGHLCRLIAKKKPALKVVGADFIAPTSDELEYHNVNITATPFTDKQFDTVISAHTLEHIIDFEEALKIIKRVIASGVQSGEVLEHYGDILYRNGETDEALTQWKKAKKLGDTSETIDQKIKDGQLP